MVEKDKAIEIDEIFQDNDHALLSVSCFHKVVDEFKQKARENKFLVRDFTYDEEQLKSGVLNDNLMRL